MNASQAEARAVLEGYKLILANGFTTGKVCSDSKEMVDSLTFGQPRVHDWRAFQEVWV